MGNKKGKSIVLKVYKQKTEDWININIVFIKDISKY